ncbi:hypothetical protein [Chitinophaga tropicalis]|uniref:hypothetical protein n=1 Tax=Chitinophaga tropicalis TaxID=2683588 RepID=UPI001E534CE0|nr:hypothetical protein [Chitinophaga tropicalis]
MDKGILYRYTGIIIILLICHLNSWGSVSLPQHPPYSVPLDSIPVKKPAEVEKQDQPVTDAIPDVIKEVPKSKKQVKPIAVPPAVMPVKPHVIIKPKIVIKKIGVRVN